ncbi:lytic transglycosylase domain-containing protein [Labedella populi]|uniref:lytic transglycosylase domain-containing protein n=1 Tax=Labedella populi TaxID=2498850 RepID=UPI001AA08D2B|nr:lytic murein transglycosylase [Labedella populi]
MATAVVASVVAVGIVVSLVVLATGVGSTGPDADAAPPPGATDPIVESNQIDAVPVPANRSVSALPDPDWVAEIAGRTGIPIRSLAAYAGAALRLAEEQPDCRLEWTTLAAIGRVETVHATIFDSALDDDGRSSPPIVGIALDGDGVLAIADTDHGALDGDAQWDRAVGPMQFIPSTWAIVGADGNADGVADAQQIDDAVLTAGRYLCAHERDLSSSADWIAAVHAYNPNTEYNNAVADFADRYATAANG